MSVASRLATCADMALLLEMMADFNRMEGIEWSAEACAAPLERLLDDPELGFVELAETAGPGGLAEPVGYAVVTFNYDLEFAGRDAFVTEIYVHPAAREHGIGKALMAAVEARARELDVLALHLAVRPENVAAIALYRAAGFARVPREMWSKDLRAPVSRG